MSLFNVLLAVTVVLGVVNVVMSILVYDFLRRRGEKVSFLLLRLLIPGYVFRYKKITQKETGRTGPLFYGWIGSINAALVTVVAAFLLR